MLLWKCYVNNKMAAMRFLHLQQYSHRLNLLCFFIGIEKILTLLDFSVESRRPTKVRCSDMAETTHNSSVIL